MKKQIITLLFLICTAAGLAAETGYRGYDWYSSRYTFPKTGQEEHDLAAWEEIIIYRKEILGDTRFLFYGFEFDLNEFINAGYVIPENKTDELKTKLNNSKKKELKVTYWDYYEFYEPTEEIIQKYGKKEIQKTIEFELFTKTTELVRAMELYSDDFYKEALDPKGPGTITIYDYNDDTRCFVFEGTYPGYTVVVYAPHEQDY